MILCERHHLESRCLERGYTLDEVMSCVVSQDGDVWTVDQDHASYPRKPKPGFVPPPQQPYIARGPGTELKKLLAGWPFYIEAAPGCSCNAVAAKMNHMGQDWCASDEGKAEILSAMRENAAEKGIPYIEAAAAMLVRRAIRNARRNKAQ